MTPPAVGIGACPVNARRSDRSASPVGPPKPRQAPDRSTTVGGACRDGEQDDAPAGVKGAAGGQPADQQRQTGCRFDSGEGGEQPQHDGGRITQRHFSTVSRVSCRPGRRLAALGELVRDQPSSAEGAAHSACRLAGRAGPCGRFGPAGAYLSLSHKRRGIGVAGWLVAIMVCAAELLVPAA
jgi:hypothetical protein